jgi:hypothetical protein
MYVLGVDETRQARYVRPVKVRTGRDRIGQDRLARWCAMYRQGKAGQGMSRPGQTERRDEDGKRTGRAYDRGWIDDTRARRGTEESDERKKQAGSRAVVRWSQERPGGSSPIAALLNLVCRFERTEFTSKCHCGEAAARHPAQKPRTLEYRLWHTARTLPSTLPCRVLPRARRACQ